MRASLSQIELAGAGSADQRPGDDDRGHAASEVGQKPVEDHHTTPMICDHIITVPMNSASDTIVMSS